MEENNTKVAVNLPKGSYVTLSKDEYMELQALKDKDYDFEKRVSEVKDKYDKDLYKFKNNNEIVISKYERRTEYFVNYNYTLCTYGFKKELLDWLKEKFFIRSLDSSCGKRKIVTLDGHLFVDKVEIGNEYEEILKLRDKTISDLKERNELLERYFKKVRKHSLFGYKLRKLF